MSANRNFFSLLSHKIFGQHYISILHNKYPNCKCCQLSDYVFISSNFCWRQLEMRKISQKLDCVVIFCSYLIQVFVLLQNGNREQVQKLVEMLNSTDPYPSNLGTLYPSNLGMFLSLCLSCRRGSFVLLVLLKSDLHHCRHSFLHVVLLQRY